jgi:hypothetical protein
MPELLAARSFTTNHQVAGEKPKNPFNPNKEMLGEFQSLPFSLPSQSITLLLPPKQQAPLNNYGESVIIKSQKVERYHSYLPFIAFKTILRSIHNTYS